MEVDTLAMNVALSTGVVADHIEDRQSRSVAVLTQACQQEVEVLLAEALL